jgi:ligand-binding sensor domain-containing protein
VTLLLVRTPSVLAAADPSINAPSTNAPTVASTAAYASSDWIVRTWDTSDGLPQNTINAMVQTRDGFLWVGTSGGLARFDGVRFRTFGLEDGLRSATS